MSDSLLTVQIGDSVIYHDSRGWPHNALVTTVWSEGPTPLVNLVFVSADESRTDAFGRQIERQTSVSHKSHGTIGNYWRRQTEAPNPFAPPVAI